jgi:hypothetical protein
LLDKRNVGLFQLIKTTYLRPSISMTGFAAFILKHLFGKNGNPPWYWHGILKPAGKYFLSMMN